MSDLIELQTETNLFGDEVAEATKIDRSMLSSGVYAQLKDIPLDAFVSYLTNKFEAMLDYANLCAGENTGQRISLLFNPHRLDVGTKSCPISLYAALKDERFVNGLARVLILKKKQGLTKDLLYQSIGMGVQGTSYVQEFPPHVARDLAHEYQLSASSHILDPCAGWGGRMLGFSAVVNSYTCCEPSTRTAAGLRLLLLFIQSFRSSFNAIIHEAPFEDVELPMQHFDFAFTSPPYYDTEQYAPGEMTNSFNRYRSFDEWCEGFYAPLIHRTMAALKPGAAFVINIGSRKYPLNDRLFSIAADRYAVEKQKGRLSASNGLGKDGEGETFYEVRNPGGYINVSQPVKELTVETRQNDNVTARAHVSALDFAFNQRSPDASPSASATTSDPDETRAASEDEAKVIPFDALFFKGYLAVKGHRLLTRDGKFFVSEAHTLTDVERATIKTHRDELIALAEPWNPIGSGLVDRVVNELEKHVALHLSAERSDDGLSGQGVEQQATGASLFEDPPTQTLAQFLNDAPIRIDINFVPDEPPDLTDINEVVLNFATDGLDWAGNARAVGVTVGTLDGKLTRFLPFAFKGGGNLDQAVIERWGKEQLQGKKIYNANTRFDMHIGRKLKGFDLEAQGCTFTDIMHTAALLDDHRKQFRLDKLAEDYLPGLEKVSRVDESQHSHYHASEVAEREKFTAELVWRLKDVMYPQLVEQELMEVQHLEDDVIPAVVEMEENGSPLDVALLDEYHAEASKRHDALLWEVAKECGFAFDHTAKSWQRLFESLGLPPTDGNNEAIVGAIDHPTVKKAHLAAQYASLDSKTFKAYKDKIGSDGILRFDINQLRGDDGGTVSGRFSIGYVQQVPNHDNHFAVFGEDLFPRRLYICGKDELDYLEADAMQIEQRLLVHYMNNPKIIKEYEGDYDRLMRGEETVSFHKVTWAMLKEYKPDMLYSHQKSFNFAKQYGARSIKLASMMGFISAAEGDEIRTAKRWNDPRLNTIHEIEAAYKKMVPEGDDLLEMASHLAKVECDQYCKRNDKFHRMYQHRGYVKTLVGRRSRFPTNYKTYIGLNRVLQGTGADIMKKKLAELHRARKYTGLVLRLTVHDAAGGGTTLPETKQRVSEVLNAQSYPLKAAILWSTNTGKNWAACK